MPISKKKFCSYFNSKPEANFQNQNQSLNNPLQFVYFSLGQKQQQPAFSPNENLPGGANRRLLHFLRWFIVFDEKRITLKAKKMVLTDLNNLSNFDFFTQFRLLFFFQVRQKLLFLFFGRNFRFVDWFLKNSPFWVPRTNLGKVGSTCQRLSA